MVSIKGDSALGIIISLVILAVLIFNVIYVAGVRQELASNQDIKLSLIGADVIFAIDIVLIIFVGIYLIYNIWMIFTTGEQREELKNSTYRAISKSRTNTGLVKRT